MLEEQTQYPQVNVWAVIVPGNILGTYFSDDNLNGQRYLQFLQKVVSIQESLFLNVNNCETPDENLWYRQGAAASCISCLKISC